MTYTSQLPQCERPGCERRVRGDFSECSLMCRALKNEYESAHNLAAACGPNESTDRYIDATLKMLRLFDQAQEARRDIRQAAIAVGVDIPTWKALVQGEYAPAS